MKSVATRRFWARLHALPTDIQELAVKNYCVGVHCRVLAELESGTVTWVWIGTHAEYDQLLRAV